MGSRPGRQRTTDSRQQSSAPRAGHDVPGWVTSATYSTFDVNGSLFDAARFWRPRFNATERDRVITRKAVQVIWEMARLFPDLADLSVCDRTRDDTLVLEDILIEISYDVPQALRAQSRNEPMSLLGG